MADKFKLKKRGMARRRMSIKGGLTIGKYPRLVVYKSNVHLYAQLVDDNESKTLASVSTNDKDIWIEVAKLGSKIERSVFIGKKIGGEITDMKIKKVIFE